MSTATIDLTSPLGPTPGVDLLVPDLVDLLDLIVSSAEPAVVFQSITQVCVPRLCGSAVAAISEAGERAYTVANPLARSRCNETSHPADPDALVAFGGVSIARTSVVTEIHGPATADSPGYEGVLVLDFIRPGPTQAVLGLLVADRAVALITLERLHAVAEMQRTRADNLIIALRSNRDIAIALGIIMSRYQLTEADAFDQLRISSQATHRKIRDIAVDIAHTGQVDLPDCTGGDGRPGSVAVRPLPQRAP